MTLANWTVNGTAVAVAESMSGAKAIELGGTESMFPAPGQNTGYTCGRLRMLLKITASTQFSEALIMFMAQGRQAFDSINTLGVSLVNSAATGRTIDLVHRNGAIVTKLATTIPTPAWNVGDVNAFEIKWCLSTPFYQGIYLEVNHKVGTDFNNLANIFQTIDRTSGLTAATAEGFGCRAGTGSLTLRGDAFEVIQGTLVPL